MLSTEDKRRRGTVCYTELELVWQVIALAVPEASGVPTLKDHLSFLVSAGFTG